MAPPPMTASRPKASPAVRQQVGTVTLTIAIYAIAYLVWERAGWGSPKVRDLDRKSVV